METSISLEWVSTCFRVGVGVFLVLAAIAKLRDVEGFTRALAGFPATERLSGSALRPVAAGIGATELSAGSLFAIGIAPGALGAVIALILAAFTVGLLAAMRRGTRLPCGCLGRYDTAVGWKSVGRNVLLLALTGVGAASPPTVAGDVPNVEVVVLFAAAAGALLLMATSSRRLPIPALGRLAMAGPGEPVAWRPPVASFASAGEQGSGSGAAPQEAEAGLAEEYSRVRSLDERAVELLVRLERDVERELRRGVLDEDLRQLTPEVEPTPDWLVVRERLPDEEDEHVAAEDELNEAISELYRRAAAEEPPSADRVLTRLALLHWTVLVRRTVMDGLHTRVDGLEEDPDCLGGVVSDRLLLRYFDTLFERGEGRGQEVASVQALVALARQSACLSTQQSAILASALYWSFVELRAFLRLNGIERVVPYVVQAATNALLLFYDVEKWRGAQAPLSRFFRENQLELREGVRTQRHPSVWHGLWLYDRRTGHLIGYAHSKQPLDENRVDLEAFFASIAERENLGRGDCSFAEMVQRGATERGYTCSGSPCEEDESKKPGERSGGFGEFLKRAGFSAGAVKETSCEDAAPGNGDDGGGDPCAGGLSAGGQDRLSSTIACLSERAVSPSDRLMKCFAEATGICADPIEKATKRLQETGLAGVKLGSGCEISASMGDLKLKEYADQKDAEAKAAAAQRDKLAKEFLEAVREWQVAEKETDKAKAGLEEAKNTPGADDDDKAIAAMEYLKAAEAETEAENKLNEKSAEHDAATEAAQKAKEEAEKAKQQGNTGQSGGTKGRCPPDTPDCGGDGCTAMSESAAQSMKCWEQAHTPAEPFERDPGNVDPAPGDDPGDSRWLACFEELEQEAAAQAVAKQCWAVDCGAGNMTIAVGAGACGCDEEGAGDGGGMKPQCGDIDCEDGSPVYEAGLCRCSKSPAGPPEAPPGPTPPGPEPKPPNFTLDAPLSFTTVRGLEMTRQQPDAFWGFLPGPP